MIAGLYTGLCGLLLIALSVNVIRFRWRYKVPLGNDNQPALVRAIRAHANFCEFVPFMLIMLFTMQLLNAPSLWLHSVGIAIIVGRILHALSVSNVNENLRLRMLSMTINFTVLTVQSLYLLYVYIVGAWLL